MGQTPETLALSTAITYELRASNSLSSIDCAKSVKDVLFSPRWLIRCNYGLHKSRRVIAFLFPLSCVAGWICPFADAYTGRVMGLLVLILQSGPALVIILVHRYDVVRLLAGTYEFWYLTLINWTVTMLGCWKYSDLRACAAFLAFIGYENALLIDAAHRGTQYTAVLSVLSGVVLMAYASFMAFNLIDEVREVVLFARGNWYVEGGDVIINGVTTIIIMLLRNAYRQRQQAAHRDRGESKTVRCITYRCRVRLVPVFSRTSMASMTKVSMTKVSVPSGSSQLRLARRGQVFSSDHVLSPTCLRLFERSRSTSPTYRVSRLAYTVLSLAAAAISLIGFMKPEWKMLNLAASAMSALHLAFSISLCQRQLLSKLISSFDVAFISTQFTLMLLSISYLLDWDHRCLSMLNCWLWIHWVLQLDARTPVTKMTLGIYNHLAIAVAVLLILAQVLVVVDLVFLQRWQLKDRILFTAHVGKHALHLRVASFMLSRIFSVIWWCWRLLWRLVTRTENELILIQEAVEYDDIRLPRGKSSTAITTTAVYPASPRVGSST